MEVKRNIFDMRIKGKVGVRIEVDRRFAETPQVQANDPVVAAKIRYPAIPEFRRTSIAVLQADRARSMARSGSFFIVM